MRECMSFLFYFELRPWTKNLSFTVRSFILHEICNLLAVLYSNVRNYLRFKYKKIYIIFTILEKLPRSNVLHSSPIAFVEFKIKIEKTNKGNWPKQFAPSPPPLYQTYIGENSRTQIQNWIQGVIHKYRKESLFKRLVNLCIVAKYGMFSSVTSEATQIC